MTEQEQTAETILALSGDETLMTVGYDANGFTVMIEIEADALQSIITEWKQQKEVIRYALATFRALDQYTFEDSDHGLLIKSAVEKLEGNE